MDAMEVTAKRKNYASLPKADAVSIRYNGNKGKFTDGKYEACSFIVMVNVRGTWLPEGVWMHNAGMKTENRRGVYTSIAKAKEAKERILTRWESELAARDAEIAALKAQIEQIKAAMGK